MTSHNLAMPEVRIEPNIQARYGVTVEVDAPACSNLMMTRLGLGASAITATEIRAVSAVRIDGNFYTWGDQGGSLVNLFIGSEVVHAQNECPADKDVDEWTSRRVSSTLAHELKHREDVVTRGQDAINKESKAYERRRGALMLGAFSAYTAVAAAIGVAMNSIDWTGKPLEYLINKHPLLSATIGLAYVGLHIVLFTKDMRKARQSFKHYLGRPIEVRARQFQEEYETALDAGEESLLVKIKGITRQPS